MGRTTGRPPSATRKGPDDTWYVYLLRSAGASLYTGITKDVKRRCKQHNAGTASRYARPPANSPRLPGSTTQPKPGTQA